MPNAMTKVYIAVMKASNGVFFYTSIMNEHGKVMTPYMSEHLDRAIHTADGYAALFGLVTEQVLPCDYVSQETIDTAYKEAEIMSFVNEKYKNTTEV